MFINIFSERVESSIIVVDTKIKALAGAGGWQTDDDDAAAALRVCLAKI